MTPTPCIKWLDAVYLLGLCIPGMVYFLNYLLLYLHSWPRSYKTGNISEAVEDKAKVNLDGLYKVVHGLSIAAQFPLTEIQLKLHGTAIPFGCKEIPDSTSAWIGFHFVTHFNAGEIIRNAATCFLNAYNAAKCDGGRGSAPDPAAGAYSALPNP